MKIARLAYVGLLASLVAAPAFAADSNAGAVIDRNVNQQERIEQGLKSGQLSTGEAARLEKGEAKIDKMESHALKNGVVTDAEKAKIEHVENRESQAINKLDANKVTGNPASASSQRMQADVQRNVDQQKRIDAGVENGSMTNREAAHAEKHEAKIAHKEYRAGRDGHVGAAEQTHIQKADNKESRKIWHAKHNGHLRHGQDSVTH
jgi:hypothetical protein